MCFLRSRKVVLGIQENGGQNNRGARSRVPNITEPRQTVQRLEGKDGEGEEQSSIAKGAMPDIFPLLPNTYI